MSFQEKSLWVMLVALVAAFGFYFTTAFDPRTFVSALSPVAAVDVTPPQVARFVLAVGVIVVVSIVGHVLITLADRRTQTDERDELIGLRGTRNGSFVLATGVFLALCAALVTRGNFVFAHVLLAFWVLAEVVEIGTRLVLYRRGA
jgi:hypothetical protein